MQSFLKPSSIGFRLLAFLLVGGLLPIAILGWFVSHVIHAELRGYLLRELSVEVEQIRNDLDSEMLANYIALRRLSRNEKLRHQPARAFLDFLKETSATRSYRARDRFRCLAISDETGRWVDELGDCHHIEARTAFLTEARRTGRRISNAYMLGPADPGVDFWFPSDGGSAGSRAGLWVTLDLTYLSDMFEEQPLSGGVAHDLFVYTDDQLMLGRRDPGKGLISNVGAAYPLLSRAVESAEGNAIGEVTGQGEAVGATARLVGLIGELEPLRSWRVAVIQPLDDRSEPTVVLIERLSLGIKISILLTVLCSLAFAAILLRGIVRPVRQLILATLRVRSGDLSTPIQIRGVSELSQLGLFFNEMREQLRVLMEQLTEMATTDPLTGLANRRSLSDHLERECKRASRYQQPLSVALMDIDHFKVVNDLYGHLFGDKVLKEIAKSCSRICRDTDVMARYGGEEFAFVLPQTDKDQALHIMERMRHAVESTVVRDAVEPHAVRVTASIGVANVPADCVRGEDLLGLVDEALYRAKSGGRNRVIAA